MGEAYGFYTDTTVCIGCKACQVACHQWNDLPAQDEGKTTLTGNSYDNTGSFSDVNWRHVKFIERSGDMIDLTATVQNPSQVSYSPQDANRDNLQWLMMSDVCKHCVNAPCLEVCPTGAIVRTEFDSVYIQPPVCNGCRDCVSACPFGVIHMGGPENEGKGIAKKCTLCYDRMQHSLTPACAQACPTESIQFGKISELKQRAEARVKTLHDLGHTQATLYGADEKILGGLNSFYLLMDKPEVYGLPSNPKLPSRSVLSSTLWSAGSAVAMAVGALFAFRKKRMDTFAKTPEAREG